LPSLVSLLLPLMFLPGGVVLWQSFLRSFPSPINTLLVSVPSPSYFVLYIILCLVSHFVSIRMCNAVNHLFGIFILACFSYFERLLWLPCCLCIPPINFWMALNQSLWNFSCISWHLICFQWHTSWNPPINQCVYMCIPLSLLGSSLLKMLPQQRIHT
jgi:hypothetical protein